MIGCFAKSVDDTQEVVVDKDEILEARFFEKSELSLMLKGKHPQNFILPHSYSLSYHMIKLYFDQY